MRKPHIITIAGAGSARVPALVGTLVQYKERFPVSKMIFYDIDGERMGKMEAYDRLVLKCFYPECDVVFTTDEDEAYSHTDFIFCQMRVGKTEMRSLDEKIPLKYGLIGQETCGPGGFAYGMRSLGAMKQMVEKVRSYSKDTWILNYTNPAAIVALGLDQMFPDDKRILNLCDQPFSMMKSFAKILGVPQEILRAKYFGLNHFGWFTDLYGTDGKNYFDQLRTYLRDHEFKPYNAEQRSKSWLETYVRVNKYMQYLDEYVPTTYLQYYMFPDEIVKESDPNYTRADEVIDGRETRVFKECEEIIKAGKLGDKFHAISDAHAEMMIKVAEAIAFNTLGRFILIVENNGAIANMQDDAMVEVVCELGINGPRPMRVGNIPQFYLGLLVQQVSSEKLLVDAYYEHSYQKAFEAFTLNRLINDAKEARKILDALIEANGDQWPELK